MSKLFNQLFERTGRKIIGVGKNYFEGSNISKTISTPKSPIIFQKPLTSIIGEGQEIILPQGIEVNHEIELGFMLSKSGKNIKEKEAMDFVGGYFLALDMTARTINQAKANAWPWDIHKGYDTFLPLSRFIRKSEILDPHNIELELFINGITRQKGNTSDMIFKIPALISYCSQIFTLNPGDLILTGTPAGIDKVRSGDNLVCVCRKEGTEIMRSSFNVA